ncbi:Mini-ribonuclease 3 [uncultured Ruminococcus sp.]|uniref:Mini-ribonuclease 3 n=1 Tax=uncultured Ruminococcus sp. TaxID=165186 RepID=UPI002634744A|nr:ribonuclease III domain-containing protein [uncultured Ruminococcus sp.]
MSRDKLTEREANSYSPLTLAFLGDSVYDTLIREHLLRMANMPVAKLHSAKIRLVCAEFQSKAYDVVAEQLSEHELAVLKRGRNATGNTVPKHADAAEYRRATALECLFGYLYLTGSNERIYELFEIIINSDINNNEQIGV